MVNLEQSVPLFVQQTIATSSIRMGTFNPLRAFDMSSLCGNWRDRHHLEADTMDWKLSLIEPTFCHLID